MDDHVYGSGNIRRDPSSPFWWAQWSQNGKDIRKSTKIRVDDDSEGKAARRWLQKMVKATAAGTYEPTSDRLMFEDAAQMLMDYYTTHGHASIGAAKASLNNLRRHLGNMKLRDIGFARIERYKAARLEEPAHNRGRTVCKGTIDHELATLRRMFTLSIEAGRLTSKPRIVQFNEDNAREGFVDPADFERLLALLPDDGLRELIEFRYLASWRPKEAAALLVTDLDLENRAIRLKARNSKNGRPRMIKLSGRMMEVITRALSRRSADCPNLFQRNGKPIGTFYKSWKTACQAAGLPGLISYDLRRSGVRNLVRSGVPEAVAMRISGHVTRRVFERYNIVDENDLEMAGERLDQYLDKKTKEAPKVVPLRRPAAA
jgi:integrase